MADCDCGAESLLLRVERGENEWWGRDLRRMHRQWRPRSAHGRIENGDSMRLGPCGLLGRAVRRMREGGSVVRCGLVARPWRRRWRRLEEGDGGEGGP